MSTSGDWVPPEKVEDLNKHLSGNKFAGLNAPTAGPRETRELPVGTAPLQLYSLGTPNGQKVSILLEELGVEYDAHTINIGKGEQFTSGFVGVNPNSKIPALLDKQGPDGKPITVFESANIVLYLAEKYGNKFWFTDPRLKYEGLNWIFWQMAGQGPMTGQFGHFFAYAPADKHEARNYGVSRYGMEVQRLCDVLDKHLAGKTYIVGETYSIVDIIIFPWWRALLVGYKHPSGRTVKDFLGIEKYTNVMAWFNRILERPAVQRGITVNDPPTGVAKPWLQKKD